jgi:hypothetical protein
MKRVALFALATTFICCSAADALARERVRLRAAPRAHEILRAAPLRKEPLLRAGPRPPREELLREEPINWRANPRANPYDPLAVGRSSPAAVAPSPSSSGKDLMLRE